MEEENSNLKKSIENLNMKLSSYEQKIQQLNVQISSSDV